MDNHLELYEKRPYQKATGFIGAASGATNRQVDRRRSLGAMIDTIDDRCDVTRLIRSIQRLEGNPDCFGTAGDSCEQVSCAWREYCLKPQSGPTVSSKEGFAKTLNTPERRK
jgi:hypothetical protein